MRSEHFVRLSDHRTINLNHIVIVEWKHKDDKLTATVILDQGGQIELNTPESEILKRELNHQFDNER